MINTSELEKEYKELLIKNNSGNSMELLQKEYSIEDIKSEMVQLPQILQTPRIP